MLQFSDGKKYNLLADAGIIERGNGDKVRAEKCDYKYSYERIKWSCLKSLRSRALSSLNVTSQINIVSPHLQCLPTI